jgi:hypothetical protein
MVIFKTLCLFISLSILTFQSRLPIRVTTTTTTGTQVLAASDFSLLGYYDLQPYSLDTPFNQGLSSRYVSGDFRILTIDKNDALYEMSLAGHAYGDLISAVTNSWPGLMADNSSGAHWGIWWEEASARLWTTDAVDYTDVVEPTDIEYVTLNSNGTISNRRGPYQLFENSGNIPRKRVYGAVQAVPTWFQTAYGVGPYVAGFGGYTSLMAQGGTASLGLTAYAFADPTGQAANANITAKTMADHASGSAITDWYATAPTTKDRTRSIVQPTNQFDIDSGTFYWTSPAPDGYGRWTWGASYNNTCQWIEGPNKRGLACVATLCTGTCYYFSSNLNWDGKTYEFHVYDVASLGAVAQGSANAWNVQPASMASMTLSGMGTGGQGGGTAPAPNVVIGATYDATTHRYYLLGTSGGGGPVNRLYVYAVDN